MASLSKTHFLRRSIWPFMVVFLPTLLYATQNYFEAQWALSSSDTKAWGIFHSQMLYMLNPLLILQKWFDMFLTHWRISPILAVAMAFFLGMAMRQWYKRASIPTGALLLFAATLYQEPGYILLCIIHLYCFG